MYVRFRRTGALGLRIGPVRTLNGCLCYVYLYEGQRSSQAILQQICLFVFLHYVVFSSLRDSCFFTNVMTIPNTVGTVLMNLIVPGPLFGESGGQLFSDFLCFTVVIRGTFWHFRKVGH